LALQEDDVAKMLAACTHIGASNVDFQMESYIFKRKNDGTPIINLRRTWEKLLLAARAVAAIENPADVFVISSRSYGQRAVLKFAAHTGCTPIAGRFTPGAFTNQIQAAFREPRLLVVTDPRADHQPVTEASYVNIPVVAFCNTDALLRYVDICVPCNNKAPHSIGLMWWMMAREVLRLRGTISRDMKWDVMADLFFHRDPEEVEKEEQAKEQAIQQEAPAPKEDFGGAAPMQQENWDQAENWDQVPAGDAAAATPVPAAAAAPVAATYAAPTATSDWSQQDDEWTAPPAATPAAPAQGDWGGSTNWS